MTFEARGINVHDPQYGAWWQRGAHQQASHQYNREWGDFLAGNPSRDEVIAFGRQQSHRYGVEPGF
jgi:hypothetical protein